MHYNVENNHKLQHRGKERGRETERMAKKGVRKSLRQMRKNRATTKKDGPRERNHCVVLSMFLWLTI